MIEIEKKFIFTPEQEEKIIAEAKFVSEKNFTDSYYDTQDFVLAKKNMWLRVRDGKFELKKPLSHNVPGTFSQYEEVDNEAEIRAILDIEEKGTLLEDLADLGYFAYCTFSSNRRKYSLPPFVIDLDKVDYTDFQHSVGEIELMIENESRTEEAIQTITVFAQERNIELFPVRGKVTFFLEKQYPEKYQEIKKCLPF